MKSLLNIFRKKEKSPDLQLLEIDYRELPDYPDLIASIKKRSPDIVIIRNVLPLEEVQHFLSVLKSEEEVDFQYTDKGFAVFPRPFDEKHMGPEALKYQDEFWKNHQHLFKKDLPEMLREIFSNISGKRDVKTIRDEMGLIHPASFRMAQHEGGLKLHCGNQIYFDYPKFYQRIDAVSSARNQLSFFIMLQHPQHGGELLVTNIAWNEKQEKTADYSLMDEQGNIRDLTSGEGIKKLELLPRVGDMLIFAGGELWHTVKIVEGDLPRITFGGFITESQDEKSYYFWS